MEFNHRQLPDVFDNVDHAYDSKEHEWAEFHSTTYSVKDDNGKEAGTISFGMGKMDVLVAGESYRYFQSSIPIETFEQIKSDLARTGLILINKE